VTPASLPVWLADLISDEHREALAASLRGGESVLATALAPAARLMALAVAVRELPRNVIVVVPDDNVSKQLSVELAALLADDPGAQVVRLPTLDADPYRGMPSHPSVSAQRVAALDALVNAQRRVVIAPAPAFLTFVPPAEAIRGWARTLTVGEPTDIDELALHAVKTGYRHVDTVTSPGDLARRGGLLDIWPPQEEQPLRLELFGDAIESIRRFDSVTQRTVARIVSFRLLPAREIALTAGEADLLLERMVGRARHVLDDLPATESGVSRLVEEMLGGLEATPRLFRDDVTTLSNLCDAVVAVWEPDACAAKLRSRWDDLEQACREREGEPIGQPAELFVIPEWIERMTDTATLALASVAFGSERRRHVDLGGRPARRYQGRMELWLADLKAAYTAGRPIAIVLKTAGRRDRVKELIEQEKLPLRVAELEAPWAPTPGEIVLSSGALDEGVEFGASGALLFGEHDLFGDDPPAPAPKKRSSHGSFLSDLRDLKEDDLVVHIDHGVARYRGLTQRPVTGEELLTLQYAGGAKLYVPVSRLDLIQKYSGGENAVVPLDKLGGPGWDRRRQRVKKAVEKIAGELLELYAKRKAVKAQVYDAGTEWQREFDASFPHELTFDQQSALQEIRADLASGRAMDRLLCGDVGYGKTEVALRAAFEVLQAGYQVAILAPTTVLAMQHLATVRARMAAWPVRVEAVSRFHAAAEIKRTLADCALGEVDMLIGTHRLLSADVKFKRLGLLIIDEEQRFGVRHKEAIKKLSLGIHSLAMSATPIPRTLQLSLAGVRDMSVIETPPRNRLAIQTLLAPASPSLVSAAVRNEIKRGGQVYYITPRVQGIEEIVAKLKEQIPELEIACVHGQLPDGELERAMLSFVRGEAQVLVATSIIENGLDISRANTIIIDRAHRFGLSQLYQMRGRVGRSDVRAYAYLLVPSRKDLTNEARQRLGALVEFSDLGSGFRIAALDLEIRGAGEMLGASQSGHMEAVGFELYIQMLEEAVSRLRGKNLPDVPEPVTLNLGVPAHLPEALIPIPGHRLAFYKRLSAASTREEVQALMDEAHDRYGRLPEPAQNLFRATELKVSAMQYGAIQIDWSEGLVTIKFGTRARVDGERVYRLVREDATVRLLPNGSIRVQTAGLTGDRLTQATSALMKVVQA
jgi:transcription-repair coupling factor (superfamily II helicase)